jgi:hypothetical protein
MRIGAAGGHGSSMKAKPPVERMALLRRGQTVDATGTAPDHDPSGTPRLPLSKGTSTGTGPPLKFF